jgi:hypothetical protein
MIPPNTAKFLADYPGFAGLIFDSTFSLSNGGESLILRDGTLTDADSFIYTPSLGGVGDGNSLQKNVHVWISAIPTPGLENTTIAASSIHMSEGGTATSTSYNALESPAAEYSAHSKQSEANITFEPSELEVSAGRSRLGFVGIPLPFEAKTKSSKNIPLGNAVLSVWSMGDGSQKSGEFVSHSYEFPGEYIVILNSQSGGASAVSKVKIKIINPKVDIVSATNEYIEIANRDTFELNLGGFALETKGRRFNIPSDTLVAPLSSIKLPAEVTKLSSLLYYAKIVDPRGRIIATYSVESPLIIMNI